jgi:hypothetical protein
MLMRFDVRTRLAEIRCPTLVTPLDQAETLNGLLLEHLAAAGA